MYDSKGYGMSSGNIVIAKYGGIRIISVSSKPRGEGVSGYANEAGVSAKFYSSKRLE